MNYKKMHTSRDELNNENYGFQTVVDGIYRKRTSVSLARSSVRTLNRS